MSSKSSELQIDNAKKAHYRGESFGNSMPLDNFTSNRLSN